MKARIFTGLLTVLLLAPIASRSQAPAKLQFEVATVRAFSPRDAAERRLSGTRSGGPGTSNPARITYSRQYLNLILADAFDVYWNQISGPDWIGTERYDIRANVPEGTTREQARQMLQSLLAERLGLTYHRQTKVVRGYELRLAEGGVKVKETVINANVLAPTPIEPSKDAFPVPPLQPGEHRGIRRQAGHTFLRFADAPVSELAVFLSGTLSPAGEGSSVRLSAGLSMLAPTPILDKTGLTGRYDFTFDYAGGVFFAPDALPRILSSVKSSLQKQLGLKLLEANVPVGVLVIDHIERIPAEN